MSAQPTPIYEMKRRLVLTEGGKGGTGKTTLLTALVDWYDERQYPYTLIDLDTEASKSILCSADLVSRLIATGR
jgi:cellulose biosynthesis protein BcsQ